MNNKTLALCLLAAALAGCVSTSAPIFSEHYTLTTAPVRSTAAPHSTGGRILRIAEIGAPDWLDSTNMYYRLGYRDNARIAAYGRSDWVAPPAKLLGNVLADSLSGAGPWKAVIDAGAAAESDVTLHIRVNDFEQVFSAAKQSAGVLDASATLIDDRASKVIAQKSFHIRKPAPSADAEGGVTALNEASHDFANQLRMWLTAAAHTAT